MNQYKIPLIAILCAVAITSAMDFGGYTQFSALPLLLISIVFWLIQKHSLQELGLKFGRLKYYGIAIFYPFLLIGFLALLAFLLREVALNDILWKKVFSNILLIATAGILPVLLTEEAFFRGWLWASLKKTGISNTKILFATSAAFTIWHISAVTSHSDYSLPLYQVPIYLINAMLLGVTWGLLRLISCSLFIPTICHAVWNSLAYELFGYGTKVGALGIQNTILFGPEVGILGIILNGAFLFWLWKQYQNSEKYQIGITINKEF